MKTVWVLIAAFSVLNLCACTSMSKKECGTANWTKLGHEDAEKGYALSKYEKRETQCMEHNTIADRDKYMSGYKAGLKKFCTYDSGHDFARYGGHYENSCPKEFENEFLKGFNLGAAERKAAELEEELEERNKQLEAEREEARRNEEELRQEQQRQLDELHRSQLE
jgi:Protein of unknown function (DUF2799)